MKKDLEYEIFDILQCRLKMAVERFNETLKWEPTTEEGKMNRMKDLIIADTEISLLERLMNEVGYVCEEIKNAK